MAVPIDKVTARYKALFGSIGLPKTRLNAIAAKLAERLEDEATDEDIDNELNAQNEIYPFSEIKKAEDRAVSEKKKNSTPAEPDKKEDPKTDDETPKWAQQLMDRMEKFEQGQTQKTLEERFKSDDRLEGVPAAMLKGRFPKDEEGFDAAVEELVSDWEEISGEVKTEDEKRTLGQFTGKERPASGGASGSSRTVKEASAAEADDIAKQLV